MPVYEYKCINKDCEIREVVKTEYYMKYQDREEQVCEICGEKVKFTVPKTGKPKFTGSGFYSTDYK